MNYFIYLYFTSLANLSGQGPAKKLELEIWGLTGTFFNNTERIIRFFHILEGK